jgi:hypothetical protein
MSGFRIQRLKKGERLSASNWNAMADRLEALFNLAVSYPLTMSYAASGVVLGSAEVGTAGVVARSKLNPNGGGTWKDIQNWSTDAQQQVLWDFELAKTSKFTETNPNEFLVNGTTFEGSGEYVKAMNLTRQYVLKDEIVILFKCGSEGQYFFHYQMPQIIHGTLDADFNASDAATGKLITIDSELVTGFQGTKVRVYDKNLIPSGKKLKAGNKVWASLARGVFNGQFRWQYFLQQAKDCPTT